MDLSVCDDEQDHVLVVILLELFALGDCLFEELGEFCWAAQVGVFKDVTVFLDDLVDTVEIRVIDVSVNRETVVDLVLRVEVWVADSGAKAVYRH